MHTTVTSCSFSPAFPFNPDHKKKIPQVPQSPAGFPQLSPGWVNEFEIFTSADQKEQLFGQIFRIEPWAGDNAHRAIFFLHGQGEHTGRYVHWPYYLKDQVAAIYGHDHRGHGNSSGPRGHVATFDLYADDAALAIKRFYDFLLEKFGKAEIHLVGHSMGGQIALRTILKYPDLPICSIALSSPMFAFAFPVPKLKELAGRTLRRILPSITIPGQPLADLVSSDSIVCQHYKTDPLVHGKVSPAFFYSFLEAKDETFQRAKEIKCPILVQVAMADRVISPDSIIDFYHQLVVPQRKLIRYSDLYHEIYNEPQRQQVFHDLCDWLGSLNASGNSSNQ